MRIPGALYSCPGAFVAVLFKKTCLFRPDIGLLAYLADFVF
jgi:hypothetical protein